MTEIQNTPIQFKDYLSIAGITILILVALPLLAILGLTLQFGFIIVAPVVLLSAIAYTLGRRSRNAPSVRGIQMPTQLLFDKKHNWFKRNARNNIIIGLDDFGQRIVGHTNKIKIAPIGKHLKKGDTLATLECGTQSISLPIPCNSQIVRINTELTEDPALLNSSPYQKGWIAELRPEEAVLRSGVLLRGEEARSWMRLEVDRLIAAVRNVPAHVNCLPDGGELSKGFAENLDSKTRERITKTFLN